MSLIKIALLHAVEILLVYTKSGVAPTVGEKGVALKIGETGASHLTPLHAIWRPTPNWQIGGAPEVQFGC